MPYLQLLKFWKEALITILIALISSQYWYFNNRIEREKINHQLTIAKAERHADNITASYEYQLNQLNQQALQKQNELLLIAHKKEQAYNDKLAKLEQEKKQHEQVINNLNDSIIQSNNRLSILSKQANQRVKNAIHNTRKCTNRESSDKQTTSQRIFAEQRLSEDVIRIQSKMEQEIRTITQRMSNDYAKLASECKALQDSLE